MSRAKPDQRPARVAVSPMVVGVGDAEVTRVLSPVVVTVAN